MKALTAQQITKSFGHSYKKVQVLHGIDLDVEEGEAYGFIGPNGAGKSTAIKIMMDIIRADSGEVTLFEKDSRTSESRKNIAYVPENPYLYNYLTPLELLKMGCRLHKLQVKDLRSHCMHWLEQFGIAHVSKKIIKTFSKGMTQRTALAHALACQPKLLILDEPLSGLDPIGRKEVVDVLVDYRRDGGTVFFTSHVLHDVERIADRFALINKGEIVLTKTASDFFRDSHGNFTISIEADKPLEEYEAEIGKRYTMSASREQLWPALQKVQQAGHSILSVRPQLTLENVFLTYVKGESATETS